MHRANRAIVLSVCVALFLFAPATFSATVLGLAGATAGVGAADAFEPDNTPAQASTLTVGASQAHTFHADGDADYAKFAVVSGQVFTLTTSALGVNVDTTMTLYDEDGTSELVSNDDIDESNLASSITYTSSIDGVLFVKVSEVSETATGDYTLTLSSADDEFEVDDTAEQASLLKPGLRQDHTFNKDFDADWVKFEVIEGRQYTLYTHLLKDMADSIIYLYGSDTTTLIDFNDDGPVDLGSRLVYTATETGFNYLKVVQFGDSGSGPYSLSLVREPGVYLDGDKNADVFTYSPTSGNWARRVSDGEGGFVDIPGNWSPDWKITPAKFNLDDLTDFFLFNTTSGQWFRMVNDGASGFTTQATDFWWPGWERYILDLDGDGISDFFLYDPATGVWFRSVTTPTGFTYEQGGWNPGWEIYPVNLNFDDLGDLFLINRTTGRWFWVQGDTAGFFYPVTETWFPGWVLYPGDFNGDGLSDFLLHDPPTGTYFVAITGELGYTYVQGGWSLGWTPHVADFDGDGADDLFLHDPVTGNWFEMISDGEGNFVNVGGQTWSLGWTISVADFNGDLRADILLFHPETGAWYQALNTTAGTFTYYGGMWEPGLQVVVRPPIR